MSFLDDILSVGSSISNFVSGNPIIGGIAKTAAMGFVLNQVQSSINADNSKPSAATSTRPDPGTRIQIDPDTQNAIPILYGSAFLKGVITDAFLSADKLSMYYVITICEKTGTKLSDSQASTFAFEQIYWNENRVIFKDDGFTVDSVIDAGGTSITEYSGKIRIWCFAGNSATPVYPTGYSGAALTTAWSRIPDWNSTTQYMNDLIFAVVKLDYSPESNMTNLANVTFKIVNSMTQPGDVLYDYMTNERYGAGIDPSEIYSG
jgi:hypothetical protein